LGGFLFAVLGAGFTAWSWCMATREGYFYGKASMLFPAFFVLGIALILFPEYKEERMTRGEDISGMRGCQLITPRWWVILAVAFGAGIGNYILLSSL
jgi:ABC-type Fe3+-siderophore transport system permease subunit